jgi:hypothetical protein
MYFFHMLLEAKEGFSNPFFMEAFTISSWQIWKQRNNFIFSRGQPSFLAWKTGFIDEARLQAHRISENKRALFLSWIDLCT